MRYFIVVLPLLWSLSIKGATFRPAGSYPLQALAYAVAVGDVDRDGKLDVITGDTGGSVAVWLGDGRGGLSFRSRYAAASTVRSIRLGDLNRDGNPDIVFIQLDTVSILLGNGDGTFRDGPKYRFPNSLLGFPAVADVNRDGKLDVIVPSTSVVVLLGNGDGTFRPPQYVRTISFPSSVAVADFNGDGIPDLAVACNGASQYEAVTAIVVLFGAGNGSFPFSSTFRFTSSGSTITAGDLDGDGHADIVAEGGGETPVIVLWGNGSGSFQVDGLRQHESSAYSPTLADVDGDGRLDIITVGGALNVDVNAGARTFRPVTVITQTGSAIAVGDLNSDGKPDIVTTEVTDKSPTVTVRLNAPSQFDADIGSNGGAPYGEAVNLKLYLYATAPSFTTPTGVVTWMAGATVLGTSSIVLQQPPYIWTSSFSPVLPPGTYTVTIRYSGDSLIANPLPEVVRVGRAATEVAATAATGSPIFDQPITVSLRVSSLPAPARPTGTISLREDGRELVSAVIDGAGQAIGIIPSLSGGMHVIQAAYNGDTNFAPSSQIVTLTVFPAPSSISLVCLPNPAGEGETVDCIGRAADSRAGGTVDLREGTLLLSSAALIGGRASLAAAALAKGRHRLTAAFSGDSNFLPSESAIVSADVVAAAIMRLATHDIATASPQSVVSISGRDFVTAPIQADAGPLPSELGGIHVTVVDAGGIRRQTPLYFVTPEQINCVIPDVSTGAGRVEIASESGGIWAGPLEIAKVAPGLFAANGDGRGVTAAAVLKADANGAETYSNAFRCASGPGTCAPAPIDLSDESSKTFLILSGTGLRNASILNVSLGGVQAEVVSWGEQPQYPGFDQIKLLVPGELSGRGLVEIAGEADGKTFNPLFVQFN